MIANLPVGAKIIQFTFTYSSMESNYLGKWKFDIFSIALAFFFYHQDFAFSWGLARRNF